ncbi:UTRA domain-containing protein [Nonomuraea sp. CA-218870]|uniref:UTRA domain-containing protein n=1 Tax=Nonomuraea sp. CA-218870 TaxID=3239998 RepID=UPI003D92EC31
MVAFDSGTLKVGRATDVEARLRTHQQEAARHGVRVTSQWYSAPCSPGYAAHYEKLLKAICNRRGLLQAGLEYFKGLDFNEIRARAEELTGAPGSQPSLSLVPKLPEKHTPGKASIRGSLDILFACGLAPDEVTEKLKSRMPTAEEVEEMNLPPGEPIVEVARWVRAADGQVIEFGKSIYAASRHEWSFAFEIPD